MANKIVLNESELNAIIESCVREALSEGWLDRVKSAYQGAKQAYQGQEMLDRGTEDFKQNWDKDDEASIANPFASKPENTASMQARQAYEKYKYYKSESDKYLALYNKLTKQYDLNKDGVGKRSSKQQVIKGSGVAPMRKRSKGNIPNAKGYNKVTDFRE